MTLKLLATCAAVSLMGLPALAQTMPQNAPQITPRATPDQLAVPAVTATPSRATPGSDLPASAMPSSTLPRSNAPDDSGLPRADLPQDAAPTMATPRMDAPPLAGPAPAARRPPPRAEALAPLRISDISVAPPPALGDLAPGARVVDPSGAELGQVVGVTSPKPREHVEAFCILQRQGVTVALPISSLALADGALTARETRAEVWGSQ